MKIEWHKVTTLSLTLSGIFMLGVLPVLSFYIGTVYQQYRDSVTNAPLSITSTQADILPTHIGQCAVTRVVEVTTRLEGILESGSLIRYSNKGAQVSYERIPGIEHSKIGDSVKFCLASIPEDCPVGDERGKSYHATNLRTGEEWEAIDSSHGCGGA